MNRNQYNLYISNIAEVTDEDWLISFFSRVGQIESYTYFRKSPERQNTSVLITYGLSVDVNEIIENYQRIRVDGHELTLRRTLPSTRPVFERILVSNELLISLKLPTNDEGFNETNLREYFSKYGSIISCRIVLLHTAYLITFTETYCADTAILAEPHYFNDEELILQKYNSPDQIFDFRSKGITSNESNRLDRFPFLERIRRLKHIIEAFELAYQVELDLLKHSQQEKIGKSIERMKKKNQALKLMIEEKQRMGKSIKDLYRMNIEQERNRVDQLIKAVDSLTFYS